MNRNRANQWTVHLLPLLCLCLAAIWRHFRELSEQSYSQSTSSKWFFLSVSVYFNSLIELNCTYLSCMPISSMRKTLFRWNAWAIKIGWYWNLKTLNLSWVVWKQEICTISLCFKEKLCFFVYFLTILIYCNLKSGISKFIHWIRTLFTIFFPPLLLFKNFLIFKSY